MTDHELPDGYIAVPIDALRNVLDGYAVAESNPDDDADLLRSLLPPEEDE